MISVDAIPTDSEGSVASWVQIRKAYPSSVARAPETQERPMTQANYLTTTCPLGRVGRGQGLKGVG